MGLANIVRVLRRHLLVSTLVLGIVLAAAAAFYVLTPTQYEASSTFVLFPGSEPTDQLFENHPEYAKRNSNNSFLNGGDVSTASAVLIQTMQSDDVRQRLVAAHADRNYIVALDNSVLSGGQMISITGTGTSAEMAERTAEIVGAALPEQLAAMQTVNGAEAPFLITARETLRPDQAVAKTSGKLRSVVVIVVAGAAVLFGALTVLEAMAAARAERAASGRGGRRRAGRARTGDVVDPVPDVPVGTAGPVAQAHPTAVAMPPVATESVVVATAVTTTGSVARVPVTSAPVPVPVAATVPTPSVAPAPAVTPAAPATAGASPAPGSTSFGGTRRVAVSRSVRSRAAVHPITPNGHRRPSA